MKHQIFRLGAIFLAITILISCGSKKQADTTTGEQTDLPPSLQTANNQVSLVKLTNKEQEELNVETVGISSNFIDYSVTAPGVVFNAPEHSSIISSPIDGQVSQINKYEGSLVKKGEEIFRVQSLEFGNMVSEYLQTYAEVQFQTNRLKRLEQLVEETISSESELERATSEYESASASARAAYSKLKAVGVDDDEIESFVKAKNIEPVLTIHAPIAGVIERTFVELGQSVNALGKSCQGFRYPRGFN